MVTKFTKAALRKLADKAGISIGAGDGSPYPTLEQLDAFAKAVQAICAEKCRAIGLVHHQQPDRYSAGKKAGAFECADALMASAQEGKAASSATKVEPLACPGCGAAAVVKKNGSRWKVLCEKNKTSLSACQKMGHTMTTRREAVRVWNELK